MPNLSRMLHVFLLLCVCCVASTSATAAASSESGGGVCQNPLQVPTHSAFSPCARRIKTFPPPLSRVNTPVVLGKDFKVPEAYALMRKFTSVSDWTGYPSFCLQAAQDDITFAGFQSDPVYQNIVGHLTKEQGADYLARIERLGGEGVWHCLPQWKTLDTVGSPNTIYDFTHAAGSIFPVGYMSSQTLRYIHVLLDIAKSIGSLSGYNIAEIGGGFGGQAKIISDVYDVASYTIVDLPEVLALTSRVLSHFPMIKNRSIFLASSREEMANGTDGFTLDDESQLLPNYDLCISAYAYTELAIAPRKRYWEKIISRCTRGYIIDNSASQGHMNDMPEANMNMSTNHLRDMLQKGGMQVTFEPEVPLSGWNNRIMRWRPEGEKDKDFIY